MKVCCKCKLNKPEGDFNKKTDRGLQPNCRSCCHILFKEYYTKNKERHLAEVKKSKRKLRKVTQQYFLKYLSEHPCVDCGETDIVVLEFDHVRGTKHHNVTNMIASGYSLERINDEIAKCEVRCCNCHRRRTSKNNKCYRVLSSTG